MKMPEYFPLFIDISDKLFLIIGAGNIAYRRINTLMKFSPSIVVIARDISNDIACLNYEKLFCRKFDIKNETLSELYEGDFDYLLLASDDVDLHRRLSEEARLRGAVVNDCIDKKNSDFYFPSIINHRDVNIALSSSGRSPAAVRRLRENIEKFIKNED